MRVHTRVRTGVSMRIHSALVAGAVAQGLRCRQRGPRLSASSGEQRAAPGLAMVTPGCAGGSAHSACGGLCLLQIRRFWSFLKTIFTMVLCRSCTLSSVFLGWEVGRIGLLECQCSRKETLFYIFNPNLDFHWSGFSSSFLSRIVSDIRGGLPTRHGSHSPLC